MGYAVELFYVAAVVGLLQLIGKRTALSPHISRKIIHILIAFVWVFQYYFFRGSHALLIVPFFVTLLLFFAARYRLVSSMVNESNPYGIFYYALSVSLVSILSVLFPESFLPSGAAIFCLSFGDGFAALIGSAFKRGHRILGEKTLEGTLACFLFSLAGLFILGLLVPPAMLSFPLMLLGAVLTTLFELIGGRFDNLLIVLGVTLGLWAVQADGEGLLLLLLLTALLALLLVIFSVKKGVLTAPGAGTAALLLLIIALGGGWAGVVYIIALYLVAFSVHLLDKKKKNRHSDGARSVLQVLCNGLFGTLSLLLFFITKLPAFYYAYFVAIGEFLADTLASDIGTLFPGRPVDICRLRRIERGQSGGVSPMGTAASLGGCVFSFLLSWLLGLPLGIAALCALLAFLGMLLDSVLGSLLQEKLRCTVCGSYTEKKQHCGTPAEHIGGCSLIGNSTVNLLTSFLTTLAAVLLFL